MDHRQYDSYWMTTGDPLSWMKANIDLMLRDKKYESKLREYLAGLGQTGERVVE